MATQPVSDMETIPNITSSQLSFDKHIEEGCPFSTHADNPLRRPGMEIHGVSCCRQYTGPPAYLMTGLSCLCWQHHCPGLITVVGVKHGTDLSQESVLNPPRRNELLKVIVLPFVPFSLCLYSPVSLIGTCLRALSLKSRVLSQCMSATCVAQFKSIGLGPRTLGNTPTQNTNSSRDWEGTTSCYQGSLPMQGQSVTPLHSSVQPGY